MTDTTVTPYPKAPAEVAAAVLDRIEQYPETFNMDTWATLPSGILEPNATLECGTTMCIAGWAVYLTGHTLHRVRNDTGIFASKGGRRHEVETAAAEVLGLTPDETHMFWLMAPEALAKLREIAAR